LRQLVEAVRDGMPSVQETDWLEWKHGDKAAEPEFFGEVSRHIIGFANRHPDYARAHVEGCGYLLIGVEKGGVSGVGALDPANLQQGVERFTGEDGPRWTVYYPVVDAETVLVFLVEPPNWGDIIHYLRTGYGKYRSGAIFIREPGKTDMHSSRRAEVKIKSSVIWFIGVTCAAIFWLIVGTIGPHAQAFHGFGSAWRSSYALHGTVLCAPNATSDEAMKAVLRVVKRRLIHGFGDTHAQVARLGKTCIVVASDPITRRQSVLAALAVPGYLVLTNAGKNELASGRRVTLSCKKPGPDCPPGSKVGATNLKAKPYPILQIVVPGTYVQPGSAQVGFDTAGLATVDYTLTGRESAAWCAFTSTHVGTYSAIVLDNRVVIDPLIQGAICGGQTQITGLSSTQDAKRLVIFLNYGALPVALHITGTQ